MQKSTVSRTQVGRPSTAISLNVPVNNQGSAFMTVPLNVWHLTDTLLDSVTPSGEECPAGQCGCDVRMIKKRDYDTRCRQQSVTSYRQLV